MDESEIERRYPFGMQRFLNPNPPSVDDRIIIEFRGLPCEAKGRSFWDYGLPPVSGTNSEVKGENNLGSGHPFHHDRFSGPIPPHSKVVAIELIPSKIPDIVKLIEEAEVGNPNRVVTSGIAHPELDYLERKYGGRYIMYSTHNGYAIHHDRSRGPPPPDMKVVSYEIHPNAPKEFDPCVEDEDEDEEVLVKNDNLAADLSSLTTGAASSAKAEGKGRSVFDDDLSLSSEEAVVKNPDPAADSSPAATGAAVSDAASVKKADVGDLLAQMSEEVRVLKRLREYLSKSRETYVQNLNPAAKSPAAIAAVASAIKAEVGFILAQMSEEVRALKRLREDFFG